MSFGEFNKYVFREEPTNDPIQELVNKHSYEEDDHWLWFLEDLETLGINKALKFSDALNFVWSEETKASRWVSHQIFQHACGASLITKLLILEVLEATGNVFFSTAQPIAEELLKSSLFILATFIGKWKIITVRIYLRRGNGAKQYN